MTMYNEQCTINGNDERQKREDNGNIDSVSERYHSHGMTDRTERWPTKTLGYDGRDDNGNDERRRIATKKQCAINDNDNEQQLKTMSARNDERAAFTLVELVITIAIVIILSVISVPIYRGYVDKAKFSEGYALLGTILSAQKTYYSEHGNFLGAANSSAIHSWTCYETVFGIDARGNKYFTWFQVGAGTSYDNKTYFHAIVYKPNEYWNNGSLLCLQYNITKGGKFIEYNASGDGEKLDPSWYN